MKVPIITLLLISNVLLVGLSNALAQPDVTIWSSGILTNTSSSVELTAMSETDGVTYAWNGFTAGENPVTVTSPGVYYVTAVETSTGLSRVGSIEVLQVPNAIWYEDFDNLPNGLSYHAGQAGWDGEASDVSGYFTVVNNAYVSRNLDEEVVWKSEVINTRFYSNIGIRVDLSTIGALESHEDYIKVYYKLDGGPETLLNNGEQWGSITPTTATATGLEGDQLQIIIKVYNDNSAEYTLFDNVIVTADAAALPANTVWHETFNGLPDFSTASSQWTRDISDASIGSVGYFEVRQNRLLGRQLNGVAKLISEPIDISAHSSVDISADLSGFGKMENSDYVAAYYRLDGGNEVLIGGFTNASATPVTVSAEGVSGNTLQLIIKASNSSDNERHVIENILVASPLEITEVTGGTLTCAHPEITLGATASYAGVNYLWEGPDGFLSTEQNPTVSIPGTYQVTVTDPTSQATSTASVEVSGGGEGIFWREDFTLADGTGSDSGSTSWTTANTGSGDFEVSGNEFVIVNTGAGKVGTWTSGIIDISDRPDVTIALSARSEVINNGNGLESSGDLKDYLRLYYKLNGGTEILAHEFLGEINGNSSQATLVTSGKLNGSTLQVIVKGRTTATDELYYFDNVGLSSTVTATATVDGNLTCANALVTISGASNAPGVTYSWTGPNNFTADTQLITVHTPGEYTLVVSTPEGCTGSTTATVPEIGRSTVWHEDFSLANGTASDNGTTSWSVQNSGSGTFSVQGNEFQASFNSANEGVWISELIDISQISDATISADLRSATTSTSSNFESDDYIRVYYKLDGGAETLIFGNNGGLNGSNNTTQSTTIESGPLNGSTVQVIFRVRNSYNDEFYYFDNVAVIGDGQTDIDASATVNGAFTCGNTSVDIVGESSAPNVTYSWTGPNDFTANTQVITVSTPGVYTLVVTASGGCTGTATATVPEIGNTATLWNEGFSLANGTTSDNGATSWSVNTPPGTFSVSNSEFLVTGTGTTNEGVWTSESIDISQVTDVAFSVDVRSSGVEMNTSGAYLDYLRVYYKLDGGSEVLVEEILGSLSSVTTISESSLNGASLQVIIKAKATGTDEFYHFDNVTVTGTGHGSVDAIATVNGTLTCSDTTVTIAGNPSEAGATYSWSGPNDFVADTREIAVSNPGDYTLVVSVNGGCSGTATATVTQDVDIPNISISPVDTLSCATTSVNLTASSTTPNATISWNGFTPGENSIEVSTPETFTATVVNSDNGCTNRDSIAVVQDNSQPETVTASNTGPLTCETTSVELVGATSSEGVTYQWLSDGDLIATTATTFVNSPGLYTLEVTKISTGCTATTSTEVGIDYSQPEGITASNSGPLTCETTSVELVGATSSEGVTYQWFSNGDLIATTATTFVNSPGLYTLEVTKVSTGCTATTSTEVGIDYSQPEGITASNSGPLTCETTSVELIGANSSDGVTYQWFSNGDLIATTATTFVNSPGLYTLEVTKVSTGCTATTSTEVGIDYSQPEGTTASNSGPLTCETTSVELIGANSSDGVTYQWFSNGDLIATTATTFVNSPGLYTLEVTKISTGCTATTSTEVGIDYSQPEGITANNSGPLTCETTSVELVGATSSEGVTYQWLNNGDFIATTATTFVNSPGLYTLEVTKISTGCTATTSTEVGIDYSQPEGITASNSGPLTCETTSVELVGATSSEGVTYQWLSNGDLIATTATTFVNSPGLYTLEVTKISTGCTATTSTEVGIDYSQPEGITASNSGPLTCETTSVELVGATSSEGVTYQWLSDGDLIATTATTFVNSPGLYTFEVTKISTGCTATTSTEVGIDYSQPACLINEPASAPEPLQQNTITAIVVSDASYSWSVSGQGWSVVSGEDSPELIYEAGATGTSATFTLTTKSNVTGCSNTCSIVVGSAALRSSNGSSISAVERAVQPEREVQLEKDINIESYPNPFSERTRIDITSDKDDFVTVMLYEMNGTLVKTVPRAEIRSSEKYTVLIDGSDLKPGTYYCVIATQEKVYTRKLILVRN